jgi:hypothetical protein
MSCVYHGSNPNFLANLLADEDDDELADILQNSSYTRRSTPSAAPTRRPLEILRLNSAKSARVRMTDLTIEDDYVPTESLLQNYC